MSCSILINFLPVMTSPSTPLPLYSFIYPGVYSLPCRIARGAGRDPGQPVSTSSSEVMSQQRHCVSLLQHCSLPTPLETSLGFDLEKCPQLLLIPILMKGRMCPSLNLKTWSCPTEANNPRNRGSV